MNIEELVVGSVYIVVDDTSGDRADSGERIELLAYTLLKYMGIADNKAQAFEIIDTGQPQIRVNVRPAVIYSHILLAM